MIIRQLATELRQLLTEYPVVTILGPRQAGKTTLSRGELGGSHVYANLELPEARAFAEEDPKGFLNQFQGPVILDEIQRVPELISYIQVAVDENPKNGQFVLTGSHQLSLHQAISQSLAGRTSILHLYPFSVGELASAGISYDNPYDYLFTGFLPRIHDQNQRPSIAYSNYYQTYVERDVRQLINLKDLSLFEKFIKLLAGRVGQLMDYASLANATGVSVSTVKEWLSILEASYIIFKLPPYYENFGKRVIKSPKYYFVEPGLLVFLLGIKNAKQISRDPLVGNLFENLIVTEFLKSRTNNGLLPNIYFFRDSNGNEVDIVLEDGRQLITVEIKANATFRKEHLKGLKRMESIADKQTRKYLIYAGDDFEFSEGGAALRYDHVATLFDHTIV